MDSDKIGSRLEVMRALVGMAARGALIYNAGRLLSPAQAAELGVSSDAVYAPPLPSGKRQDMVYNTLDALAAPVTRDWLADALARSAVIEQEGQYKTLRLSYDRALDALIQSGCVTVNDEGQLTLKKS